jgi:uncharacterized protein YkwD
MRFSKFISSLTVVALLSCAAGTAQAAFSDVSEISRYATAIDYLSTAGIIGGYPDGTFRPGNPVNRVEFLKLALESSGIKTDVPAPTGFSDIDESAWYAKYVRKAYKEGWVEGYGDSTFRPENPITKAEGLKMIGKILVWKTPALTESGPFTDTPAGQWFTPFISYAKAHNFLEENGRFYIPDTVLTREKTAEILFRTYSTRLNGAQNYSTRFALTPPPLPTGTGTVPEPAPEVTDKTDFTPVQFVEYPTDFFEGVTLTETFPNTFYQNELYYFEGMSGESGDKAFVFLIPEKETDPSKYINNVGKMENGKLRIPVYFGKTGNYQLGLIPGSTGQSKVLNISVLPALPTNTGTNINSAPSNPDTTYIKANSTISWESNGNELIRVLLYQGTKTRTFIFRQGISSFQLPYAVFDGFDEGQTNIIVEGAPLLSEKPLVLSGTWKKSGPVAFMATGHHFTENDSTGLTMTSLPETYSDGQTITLSGTAKTEIYADAAVTKPDGSVEMSTLSSTLPYGEYYSSQTIPAGGIFTFRYRPTLANGTYFIEINSSNGEALLNYPVYLKDQIPLIPDFVDLSAFENHDTTMGLDVMRTRLQELINADRTAAGLSTIKLDSSLNNLAQLQSEDMVKRDFFGHINPDGESPEDRRIKLGITTAVGENLAQAPTVNYAHYGLMRSGIHRRNILDPQWTRFGLGITRDTKGNLFVTEEFSTDPLTEIDLINLEKEILQQINAKRTALSLTVLTQDPTLSQIADYWSEKMTTLNFFDFTSPDGESLNTAVRTSITNRAVQAQILESRGIDKLEQEILSTGDISLSTWSTLGIGLKVDNIGTLKATLLYSTH